VFLNDGTVKGQCVYVCVSGLNGKSTKEQEKRVQGERMGRAGRMTGQVVFRLGGVQRREIRK
jgi:hypothetical protein